MTKAEALRAVAFDAYYEAEAGLGFAMFRMAGYAARRLVEERFGIPADSVTITHNGDWGYALRSFKENDPTTYAQMNIYQEPRGVGYEPHTGREVRFGTAEVRSYVQSWSEPDLAAPRGVALPASVETFGPEGRYGGVLLLEKQGLLPVVRAARIGERFDLMVAATQGQGVTAVKELIEELAEAHPGVIVYLLHDFDVDGTSIAACLAGKDSKSWAWSVEAKVIDLGLALDHVRAYDVLDESVSGKGDRVPLLRKNGCTEEAIGYLISEQREEKGRILWTGRRAELNGLIGQRFIDFIEERLAEARCEKVVPDEDDVEAAYRRAVVIQRFNQEMERVVSSIETDDVVPPPDLIKRVTDALQAAPHKSWDWAVERIAAKHGGALDGATL